MKRKLFSAVVTAGLFTSFTPAWAATCTTAPVSTYTAAGFSCNIGGLTFSNIVVTPILSNGGTVTLTDFAPVNPVAGEFGLRLDYTASAQPFQIASVQWTYSVAGVPNIGDAFFAFDGSAQGTAQTGAMITLSNISGPPLELTPGAPSTEIAFTLTSSINGNATQFNNGVQGTVTGRSSVLRGHAPSHPAPRRAPALRYRSRRIGPARLAQEEEGCCLNQNTKLDFGETAARRSFCFQRMAAGHTSQAVTIRRRGPRWR